jgi:hypothetical protein
MYLLTAMAAAGIWIAWRNESAHALAPGIVFLCIAIGHALTYMDLMYYYQRVPFVYVFAAFLLNDSYRWPVAIPLLNKRLPLGPTLLGCFVVSVVALTALIL